MVEEPHARRTCRPSAATRGREKALSGFDVPHNVAISAGYELPFGRDRRFLSDAHGVVDGILGGWQVQGIYVWRSGRPFTPTISSDRANTGVGGQRPNRLGSGELDNPTVEVWFDKTAFALPAQFTYGDSGGSILREDSYKTLDFSLFKQFRIGTHRLQFRAEVVQPDQHRRASTRPNTAIDTAAGGRVTSTASSAASDAVRVEVRFLTTCASERDSVVLLEGETTNTSVWLVQGEQVVAEAQTAVGARDTARDGSPQRLETALRQLVTRRPRRRRGAAGAVPADGGGGRRHAHVVARPARRRARARAGGRRRAGGRGSSATRSRRSRICRSC